MSEIFDFGDRKKEEKIIKDTWVDFRNSMAKGEFKYNEIDKAKTYTFLRVYDDLFNQNSGLQYNTISINKLKRLFLGRGAVLREDKNVNYDRFIPLSKYIKEDNRFSPPSIEWLYLAYGTEDEIRSCAQAECRANEGDKFGFCHFDIDSNDDLKLVDLTIADDISYDKINQRLENYGKKVKKKVFELTGIFKHIPLFPIDTENSKKKLNEWAVYTYSKLLSEQIFEPIKDTDDKKIMYAPFHTMAQYYISLGYAGIMYGSTVSTVGKNIVLFDKNIAHPVGEIEEYII